MESSLSKQMMIAVGPKDKENLASPDVIRKCKKGSSVFKSTKNSFIKNSNKDTRGEMIRNKINNMTSALKVTADDLCSSSPGEGYWKELAESRRVALEATWTENVDLHKKINEMEYEVTKLKSMLAEARQAIQTLMEIAEENEDADDNEEVSQDEVESEYDTENGPADDTLDDTSFTSL